MPGSNRNWSVGAFFVLAFTMMSPVGFAQAAASTGLSGAELFKNNCALCHGDKGDGSVLGKRLLTPDLRRKEIHQKTPSALAQTISAGKKNMPPFASKLSSAEIEKLVAYVKQLHR